jgi:hypothetical protein
MTLKILKSVVICIQKPVTTSTTLIDHLMSVKELKGLGFRVERENGGLVPPRRGSAWECVVVLLDKNMLQR